MNSISIQPIKNPNGDQHHTEIEFQPGDVVVGSTLAHDLGGLFIDKRSNPDRPHRESYYWNEMSSFDVWTRVARALRFHGLTVVNLDSLSPMTGNSPHKSPGFFADLMEREGMTEMSMPTEKLRFWQKQLDGAFDLGFKAAGGTIIPDGARDTIELALTREQIDVLAEAAEGLAIRITLGPARDHAVATFLETISIYRSRY